MKCWLIRIVSKKITTSIQSLQKKSPTHPVDLLLICLQQDYNRTEIHSKTVS